ASGSKRWRISLARVDLPQPLSPTRPSVSPRWSVKLASATAATPLRRPLVLKGFETLRTCSRASARDGLFLLEEARDRLAIRERQKWRVDLSARRHRTRAARRKTASRRRIAKIGRLTCDRLERLVAVIFNIQNASEQRLGIGMTWRVEQGVDVGALDDPPR